MKKIFSRKSRPSSASSSSTSASFLSSLSSHPDRETSSSTPKAHTAISAKMTTSFHRFKDLPYELQTYIFTFLPTRILHKTIARTNKHYMGMVDAYTRRRLLRLMDGDERDGRKPETVLVFEAQRPIDTLTSKHVLYFSHFSVTSSISSPLPPRPSGLSLDSTDGIHGDAEAQSTAMPGGAYSTLINFSFVPEQLDEEDPRDELSSRASSSSMDIDALGAEESTDQAIQPMTGFDSNDQMALVPGVHQNDVERTGAEHVTSSVVTPTPSRRLPALDLLDTSSDLGSLSTTPRASTPTFARNLTPTTTSHPSAAPSDAGSSRRPFTDVAIPNQWRPSNVAPTRLVVVDDDATTPSTSSTPIEDASNASAIAAAAAAERGRAQAQDAGSLTSSQQRRTSAIAAAAARRRFRAQEGYEGFGQMDARIQGGWAEPVASTAAVYDSDYYTTTSESDEASRSGSRPRHSIAIAGSRARARAAAALAKRRNKLARAKKPTYRFQLDPLDSFETWILSLTLQRRLTDGGGNGHGTSSLSTTSMRQMRWEKRVAEGLDRVFRDWFSTPIAPQYDGIGRAYVRDERERELEQGQDALARAHRISSLHFGFTPPTSERQEAASQPSGEMLDMEGANIFEEADVDDEEEEEDMIPVLRTLEFDGPSCTMSIQPHLNKFDDNASRQGMTHPALSSMYSHNYLSSHSHTLSARYASLSNRVELTFHCEIVTINAARLLSTLEDVETDVAAAQARAKRDGDRVLAGRSGANSESSWAYGHAGSRYAMGSTTSNVMSRSDGVSVVVFGAVRD